MKRLRIIAFLLTIALTTPFAAAAEPDDGGESRFLSRVRQLTFEGRRAGEGYFSPDGSRMVFQSEREPGNPFYQIYDLDLETGESRRISPGRGKTTCAFFRAGSGDIIFASTHHDPKSETLQKEEIELRASGQERRYAWDYDPEMELYVASSPNGDLRRLTNTRGYDAEASYSPDGKWIVFTSNREAYSGELDDEAKARLEVDPAWFNDLYLARADGTGVKRLTTAPGYDGGPFFMPDGKHIVWRRFDESGLIADVWVMQTDGSDARKVTEFESMSWAPYPHPSGDYIIFTSNKHGFSNFELFIVDTAGTREPVRVTWTDGFDGLPVPLPDGRRLAWTSNRRGDNSQIYLAEWNHDAALEALAASPERATSDAKEKP